MSGNSGYNNNSNQRIEPNFFNLNNDQDKKNIKTSDVDENAYWSSLPPPYTPSTSTSEPSAPPLDPEYPQQYPPQGYHQYPQYGSTNQNNATGWPWRAPPPPQPTNSNSVLPPGIPPYEVASAEPSRNSKKCSSILFCLIPLFIFLFFYQIFGSNSDYTCHDGVHWDSLPKQFDFDSRGLSFRVSGGQVSSGTVQFKRQQEKSGLVELDAVLSPPRLVKDPQLRYSLTRGKDGSTNLEISLPSSTISSSHCITMNAVIYLPYDTPLQFLNLETRNMQFETDNDVTMDITNLVLKSANSRIMFHSRWRGKTLLLETSNARIEVPKSIESTDKVTLTTKNGDIHVGDTIQATNAIVLTSTNAGIEADKLLSADSLTVTTTNGHINLNEFKVDRTDITASNGHIQLNHGDVTTLIHAETSNARVNVNLDECQYCQVITSTSNANLKLILPDDHEGVFDLTTSGHNSIRFSDRLDWTKLRVIQSSRISGERYRPDNYNRTDGTVQAKTSNGDMFVSFGPE